MLPFLLFLLFIFAKKKDMKKILLLALVSLCCMTNGASAKDAEGDLHAIVLVEGGYSHHFGDLNSTWTQYFNSFQRQLRNGYSLQAAAMGCFSKNVCAGVVVWQKGFTAKDDDFIYNTAETMDMKYIGPVLGVQDYMGPGLLGIYASAGFTHFSDKYVSRTVRMGETVEDRFVTGAFGYLIDLKYMFCLGKFVMVGPSIGYYGFRVRTDNNGFWAEDWEKEYFRIDGFNVTACLGLRF